MTRDAITLTGLTKRYTLYENPSDRMKEVFSISGRKRGIEKCVLNNLSLSIEAGMVVGIIGTNGAGKSTLLKLITGVLNPTAGEIKVHGKVAALLELGTGFNPEFTGIKNIYLNGTMMGFSHEEMEQKLQSIIDFADIGDFIYHPVKTYSSGMFARLAFAVAINVEPDILIVDEALSVGDLRFQMKCMDKMKSMMDSGITVLFVSHDINAIRRLCTKTIWLKDGEVHAYGETNKVCDLYMDYLKAGETDINPSEKHFGNVSNVPDEFKLFSENASDVVAEILGITITNDKNQRINEIEILQKVNVTVYYDVYDTSISMPVLGVAIKRIDDEYICGVNTLLDHEIIPWKYGRNHFTLTYQDGIRILGGKYYFDVALFDKTATVPIHYFSRIKDFTVASAYIGEGICILPHEWRE